MDVDRLKYLPTITAGPSSLQWSHVLMDVDSKLVFIEGAEGVGLQWSHVLMDVDSATTVLLPEEY